MKWSLMEWRAELAGFGGQGPEELLFKQATEDLPNSCQSSEDRELGWFNGEERDERGDESWGREMETREGFGERGWKKRRR
jgi:hypothetical protein